MRLESVMLLCCTLFSLASAAILGLDIGHDFTKAALVAPGVPFEIVMSADSKRKDVSGIAFKPLGNDEFERLYGSQTASYCTRFPKQCLLNIKPLLGKSSEDQSVQHYLQSHPGVKIVPSRNNRGTIALDVEGHSYPVEEVLAMSIQNIVGRASALLKEKSPGGLSQIRDVAVTVPSFFNMAQRNAVKDSVELAGLNLIALVDDGLAIAVNYATSREFKEGETEYHIIYDMGAGSTKATFVSFLKTNATTPVSVGVESYAFDESLGGSYFTNAVADLIKAKFLESHTGIHTSSFQANHRAVAKLYQASDKAKLVLSANSEAQVSIESLYDDIDFKTKITREEFEDYIADSSTRVTDPIMSVLDKSGLSLNDLTSVIFAGGSTRVPFVQRHLVSLIGEQLVSKTINADEAAVFGTALRGVQISKMFRAKDLAVTEPSDVSYRVSVGDGADIEVFPVGTSYGQSVIVDMTEYVAASDVLSIDVLEGAKRYMTYDFGEVEQLKSKLKFNVTECVDDVKYLAKFTLTESHLFTLVSFEAQCSVVKQSFFDKLKGGDADESLQEGEKQKIKKSVVPFKTRYIGARPLGTATKQELRNHLAAFDMKDSQRKLVSEKLNQLEAALYHARSYLSDDEVVQRCPAVMIDEANALVSEYLDWLDYESDGSHLKDVRSKLDDVWSKVRTIENYIAELSIPLDAEEFERLHTEGVSSVNQLQDTFLTMGEEALSLARSFAEAGMDYEYELKKVARPHHPTEEMIEEVKANVTSTFENVKKLYGNPKKLEKLDRSSKLQLRMEALQRLEELNKLQLSLKTMHSQRTKDLKAALNKFIRAQKRAAAKEEAKRKASDDTTASFSATTSSSSDTDHDEL